MNCKIKAVCVGGFWALGLIVAIAIFLGILIGLFMLGDAYGIPIAGFIAVVSISIICFMAGKIGYDHYMATCQKKSS